MLTKNSESWMVMEYLYQVHLRTRSSETLQFKGGGPSRRAVLKSMKEEIRRTEYSSVGLDGSLALGLCTRKRGTNQTMNKG